MDYELITSLTLNEKQGEEFRLLCPHCGVKTVHRVLVSAEIEWRYTYPDDWYISWDSYQVVQCQGCEQPSFRRINRNTEDQTWDDEKGVELIEHEYLYPGRISGRQRIQDVYFLPLEVNKIYQETYIALSNKLLILAGIGIRALVETICKERKAKGKNLSEQIDDLVSQGVLTSDGAEILHGLRLLGNEAAHEVKPHTETDLNVAFDVIEHLLKGVYILPKIAERLPKRKSDESNGK